MALVRVAAIAIVLAATSVARAEPSRADPAPDVLPPDREHRVLSVAALSTAFAAAAAVEYQFRFGPQPLPAGFEVGGDGYFGLDTWAGGADKLSYAWTAMLLTRVSSLTLRAYGWRPLSAALIGAGLTSGLLLTHELEDGFESTFSPGDMIGSAAGALFGVATEVSPRFDELFDYRIEYWPSQDYLARVYGDQPQPTRSVNPFSDFSGQTYVLALHLGALPGARSSWLSWTRYIDATVSYHADGYQPGPLEGGGLVSQTFSVGISLNYLTILDRLLMGQRRVPEIRSARPAWRGVLEVLGIRGVGMHADVFERSAPRSTIARVAP